MKTMKRWIGLAVLLSAVAVTFVGPTGCAGGPKVSETSVYKGDTFLFQAERLQVQMHELFLEFYRWEIKWRAFLPAEVSRAADRMRVNEEKWAHSLDAAHDAYVLAKTDATKKNYEIALSVLRTALSEAAFWMIDKQAVAPNSGLDKKSNATLASIGIAAVAPPAPPVP